MNIHIGQKIFDEARNLSVDTIKDWAKEKDYNHALRIRTVFIQFVIVLLGANMNEFESLDEAWNRFSNLRNLKTLEYK